MKKQNGITLVSLVITIVLMLIVASTTVYTSVDRFEINKVKKMYTDIELLYDKVASYYLKYNVLPVVLDENQQPIEYNYTTSSFAQEGEKYYIIDLQKLEGISLNYGKEGFEKQNESDDVYIINKKTHQIYYVKGVEMKGVTYHTLENKNTLEDNIPPSKPELNIISGTLNDEGVYISDVEIEIIPGKDNWSGVSKTTYSINGGEEKDITTLTNNILRIVENGTYNVVAKTEDNSGNISEELSNITINKENVS